MLELPALDPRTVEAVTKSIYPAPYDAVVQGRAKRPLGKLLGLTQFGVHLTTLAPGAASALKHWHSREDEFVYVLEGAVTLVTDSGEQVLTAGMCAGYAAGVANGHQLVNRSQAPVILLEVGGRDERDEVEYPGLDVRCHADRYRNPKFTRRDGTPL
jgi:uncharacterized cupin superfamily protein